MWGIRIAALAMMVGLGRLASAGPVDLSKPFEADKDTICLFHLDDVAEGRVEDSVAGGKSGKADVQRIGSMARVGKSRLRRESHPRIIAPVHDGALSVELS